MIPRGASRAVNASCLFRDKGQSGAESTVLYKNKILYMSVHILRVSSLHGRESERVSLVSNDCG